MLGQRSQMFWTASGMMPVSFYIITIYIQQAYLLSWLLIIAALGAETDFKKKKKNVVDVAAFLRHYNVQCLLAGSSSSGIEINYFFSVHWEICSLCIGCQFTFIFIFQMYILKKNIVLFRSWMCYWMVLMCYYNIRSYRVSITLSYSVWCLYSSAL